MKSTFFYSVTILGLLSCNDDLEGPCFLQKYYLSNESGSGIEILLYQRSGDGELVKNWELENEDAILFYETEGGNCVYENNFVGDSLVFVFENQKKNIFSCKNVDGVPFHVVIDDDCYTTTSDKNALDSNSYLWVDETTDVYYIITRLDYALAE